MYIPGDFGRPPPSQLMSKNVASTFLNSSLYPVTTLDSNSVFKIKQDEFQFEHFDSVFTPEFALKIPRTPLLLTDPSTYISISPFTENNIRKYHSAIGNLNHDNIKNPLSLQEIKSQYRQDQLPLGSGVNPLVSDYFRPVHLTPGCQAEVVSFEADASPTASSSSFNLMGRSNTVIAARNNRMKLWGTGRKGSTSGGVGSTGPGTGAGAGAGEDAAAHPPPPSDLKAPKTSLSRSSSTFITKVTTTDSLNRKLNAVSELMVAVHGRFLNVINLSDDFAKIEIDIPYLRVLFSVGVITCLSCFTSRSGQERSLDVVVGFSSGDLVWLNPFKMKYTRFNKNAKLINRPVICVEWSPCGRYIYAGFANGEIMVFSREHDDNEAYDASKNVRRSHYAKFFRTFADAVDSNPVAHFQVSHKPVTAIKFNPVAENFCCIASDDGFVKTVDLSTLSICDICPSYYGGVLCVEFTRDGRYLLAGGEDDFVSVYELGASAAGNLRLLARLEGPISWIRAIRVDYARSEANLLVYRISCVGDDGKLTTWEFQPRNLPKVKRSLHHRNKSTNSPNLRTVNSGIFHRRKPSGSAGALAATTTAATAPATTVTRTRHSNSVSSANSGTHQLAAHTSIAQAINSASQLSLGKLNSADLKPGTSTAIRKGVSSQAKWTPGNADTVVHEVVGLSGVPILQPIASHDFELGRLAGLAYGRHYVWIVTTGGDACKWSRR